MATVVEKIQKIQSIIELLQGIGLAVPQISLILTGIKGLVNLFAPKEQEMTDAHIIAAMRAAFGDNVKHNT